MSDFVPTAALRTLRDRAKLPDGFEEVVARDLQPWSDFFGDGAGDIECARSAGLQLVRHVDASVETLPTYDVLIPKDIRDLSCGTGARADDTRGMAALEWAQSRGLLRMMYYAFEPAR